jgi:DNA invertase Pin-like site-specific DNA recombinase
MFLTMAAGFAELERNLIRERRRGMSLPCDCSTDRSNGRPAEKGKPMDSHDDQKHTHAGSVVRMLKRLRQIFRSLSPGAKR